MKKIFILILIMISALSCAPARINKVYIRDYNEQMDIVRSHFPQIYNLYIQGKIVINYVYTYTDRKTGDDKVNVSYHYLQN